jgi:hypothetical protein
MIWQTSKWEGGLREAFTVSVGSVADRHRAVRCLCHFSVARRLPHCMLCHLKDL